METFCKTTYLTTINRLPTQPHNCSETFITSLSKYLPHWTSENGPDEFTFATIQEGQTATQDDVYNLSKQLKDDLMIGRETFPEKVLVAGDEQTYSIMMCIKGGLSCKKIIFILLAVLKPWVEYCSQDFFVPVVSA